MAAREEVEDHSEVITALRGYSAPIPEKLLVVRSNLKVSFVGGIRTDSHYKAPPQRQSVMNVDSRGEYTAMSLPR
jgi:hypothetical protein